MPPVWRVDLQATGAGVWTMDLPQCGTDQFQRAIHVNYLPNLHHFNYSMNTLRLFGEKSYYLVSGYQNAK